jgi:D-sedoheptulose 7-phosphate isomerase
MEELIRRFLTDSANVKMTLAGDAQAVESIKNAAMQLLRTVESAGTIYICGNGGSACDSMHFAEELIARYKRHRVGIRAQHLLDPAVLTCWGNDYNFDSIFARQIETLGTATDTLVLLSTSGNSPNIIEAAKSARKVGCTTIGLSGRTGGKLASQVDILVTIPADVSDRIQESHITLIHIFCEVLETAEYYERFRSALPQGTI